MVVWWKEIGKWQVVSRLMVGTVHFKYDHDTYHVDKAIKDGDTVFIFTSFLGEDVYFQNIMLAPFQ